MTDVSFCKVQIRTSASYIKLRLESYCGPDGPHNPLSLPRAVGRIPKRSIFDCVIRPESPAPAETWPGLGSTDWISRPLHPTRQGPSPSTCPWWASRPRRVSFRSIMPPRGRVPGLDMSVWISPPTPRNADAARAACRLRHSDLRPGPGRSSRGRVPSPGTPLSDAAEMGRVDGSPRRGETRTDLRGVDVVCTCRASGRSKLTREPKQIDAQLGKWDNSVSVHHYLRKGAPTPEFPRDTGIPPTPEFPPSTGAGRLTECTRWPVIRLCFRPKPGGSCVWCLRNSARPQTQAEEDSGPAAESPSGYAVQVHVFFERKTHGD